MPELLNDPLTQKFVVGAVVNSLGALIAFYLWLDDRRELYLLYWSLAWASSALRWVLLFFQGTHPYLQAWTFLAFALLETFAVLRAYEMLPAQPWDRRIFSPIVFTFCLVYAFYGGYSRYQVEMQYTAFFAVLIFDAICFRIAYRERRLSGYALLAVSLLGQGTVVGVGLVLWGKGIATNILVTLFNVSHALGLVVVAYQLKREQLLESERTLQKIFETAPTPILITKPPMGEIERGNTIAFELLGVTPESVLGETTVTRKIVANPAERQKMYDDLNAGRRIVERELVVQRGNEERIISINADRITLKRGDRFIFSFHDMTDLRRAEKELRASAEETRQLYIRLGTLEYDERRTLHAELHDQVGANLSALRLELDLIGMLLSRNDHDKAGKHLESAREVATETMSMARNLMAELRPPALDDYGLVAALRTLTDTKARRFNLAITITGEDLSPRPSLFVEAMLFRIVQEALVNTAKHAQATLAHIEIKDYEREFSLSITDDGLGFDPLMSLYDGNAHWGLKHMRERALAIGAKFEIDTAPGCGTRVNLRVFKEAV